MKGMNINMITPAYESFVNNVCADNEYNMANENAKIKIEEYNEVA